jgi:5,10-methylenetetrahydromethanopterin reductase
MRVTVTLVARPAPDPARSPVAWIDEILARIDHYAIDRLSIGDVQGNHLECFSALGYAAARTRRVALGPLVTNAVTRDVGVLAAAAASLDALSAGRAFMVLSRGDGVVRNLDLAPHTVAQLRQSVVSLRALLDRGRARHDARELTLPWPGRHAGRVPLYLAAGGTQMLELAAQVCDGVYAATGVGEADVRTMRETVEGVGRETPFDLWWVTRFGIGESFDSAFASAAEGLSSIANHSLRGDYGARGVPTELRPALAEYHRRYRYARKNPLAGESSNVDLMISLGLRDYILERFGIVGTPDQVVARLRELERRGVDAVTLLATSPAELDLIGTRVLPALTGAAQPAS